MARRFAQYCDFSLKFRFRETSQNSFLNITIARWYHFADIHSLNVYYWWLLVDFIFAIFIPKCSGFLDFISCSNLYLRIRTSPARRSLLYESLRRKFRLTVYRRRQVLVPFILTVIVDSVQVTTCIMITSVTTGTATTTKTTTIWMLLLLLAPTTRATTIEATSTQTVDWTELSRHHGSRFFL